ncbi:MAG: YqiJ family protein [Pseudomonadota bacterium]
MDLFHGALAPFTIALFLLGFIALLEVLGLIFGVAFSSLVDSALPDIELDAEVEMDMEADLAGASAPLDIDGPNAIDAASMGPLTHFLSWLCVGKVPILILLAAFLMGFGLTGVIIQNTAISLLGGYLWPALVAIPALVVALPVTRYLGLTISSIMPKEETDAVSSETFIGQVAVIIRGIAEIGSPAEAKLKDIAGTTQYILVEPDRDGARFEQGDEVLLVERNQAIFKVIANTSKALSGR